MILNRACARLRRFDAAFVSGSSENVSEYVRIVCRGLRSVIAYERKVHFGKVAAAAEHEVCDCVRSVGKSNIRERGAVLEGIRADIERNGRCLFGGFFERDIRKLCAVLENVGSEGCDRGGYSHVIQKRAARKGVVAYRRKLAVGCKRYACKRGAVLERVGAYRGHRRGN